MDWIEEREKKFNLIERKQKKKAINHEKNAGLIGKQKLINGNSCFYLFLYV